ncbi:hypothetical protein [Parabacteroides sp. An277]|uniref:hypothetical protein n=1 Tax=Parabacteroides sp. An277 TaxID=1965619 RepID=UPI00111EB7DB|nr:hypothetical protein [Parabacteroides sp. An277]
MKKCSVWVVAALSAMMALFTSCLNGGTNEQSGWVSGVMTRNMNAGGLMMLNTGGGMLYIAELDNETNYPANTCVGVNWMIDYNADENANVAQRGYYVASILQTPEIIEKGNAGYATDTLNLMENEVLLSSGYVTSNYQNYVDGWLMMASSVRASSSQLRTMEWYLSYPVEWKPVVYQGTNCYDFYVRATMEGTDETGASVTAVPQAYNVKTAIDRINSLERASGNELYYIRFKYATDTLNNQITEWRVSDPLYMQVTQQ